MEILLDFLISLRGGGSLPVEGQQLCLHPPSAIWGSVRMAIGR